MSFAEQRKHKRIEAHIDVHVTVVFPEETFQPQQISGHTLNVSEQGMKIRMFDIQQDFYKKMLSPIRYAKVSFTLPTTRNNKVLHGKMVWLDYNPPKRECTFGVYFESIAPEDQEEMRRLIEMLEKQESMKIRTD